MLGLGADRYSAIETTPPPRSHRPVESWYPSSKKAKLSHAESPRATREVIASAEIQEQKEHVQRTACGAEMAASEGMVPGKRGCLRPHGQLDACPLPSSGHDPLDNRQPTGDLSGAGEGLSPTKTFAPRHKRSHRRMIENIPPSTMQDQNLEQLFIDDCSKQRTDEVLATAVPLDVQPAVASIECQESTSFYALGQASDVPFRQSAHMGNQHLSEKRSDVEDPMELKRSERKTEGAPPLVAQLSRDSGYSKCLYFELRVVGTEFANVKLARQSRGLKVLNLQKPSPSGLRVGDFITKVDGVSLRARTTRDRPTLSDGVALLVSRRLR